MPAPYMLDENCRPGALPKITASIGQTGQNFYFDA
jgi:hypothetical protein